MIDFFEHIFLHFNDIKLKIQLGGGCREVVVTTSFFSFVSFYMRVVAAIFA